MAMSKIKNRISKLEQKYQTGRVFNCVISTNLNGTVDYDLKVFPNHEALMAYMRSIGMPDYLTIIDLNYEAEDEMDAAAAAVLGVEL